MDNVKNNFEELKKLLLGALEILEETNSGMVERIVALEQRVEELEQKQNNLSGVTNTVAEKDEVAKDVEGFEGVEDAKEVEVAGKIEVAEAVEVIESLEVSDGIEGSENIGGAKEVEGAEVAEYVVGAEIATDALDVEEVADAERVVVDADAENAADVEEVADATEVVGAGAVADTEDIEKGENVEVVTLVVEENIADGEAFQVVAESELLAADEIKTETEVEVVTPDTETEIAVNEGLVAETKVAAESEVTEGGVSTESDIDVVEGIIGESVGTMMVNDMMADIVADEQQRIVNEAAKPDWYDWEVDYPAEYVDDVYKGISFNDRYEFIKELFNVSGNLSEAEVLFRDTLDVINETDTFKKVVAYMRENFPQWDEQSDEVYRFYMAVRRKFNR